MIRPSPRSKSSQTNCSTPIPHARVLQSWTPKRPPPCTFAEARIKEHDRKPGFRESTKPARQVALHVNASSVDALEIDRGEPFLDDNGRFIPNALTTIFVMRK